MRTTLAVLLGKSIAHVSKQLKIGGGSAAPGLYALKLDPQLVTNLSKRISKNIIITGTNGKTTTSRMIAHFANASGLKVIRNHTGSNLERGIASALISNSHIGSGKLDFDLGIWELDEAAFNTVAPKLNPAVMVILNVSRDQLDRYGEVDKVVNNWCRTLKNLPKTTTLIVNGDDKNLAKLPSNFAGETIKFSMPKNVRLNGLKGSFFALFINHKSLIINLSLPGIYHIYDTVAALTTANILKLPLKKCVQSLKTFRPAFGRVEKFEWGYIFLIKNPAGATAVFETISSILKHEDRLLLALNDELADGTDVSWIWDVNFELIQNSSLREPEGSSEPRTARAKSRDYTIISSGSRAYDLANRLKYAGITAAVEPDLKKAFKDSLSGLKGRLFILPTYTAMLELQRILEKSGIKKHYWETE